MARDALAPNPSLIFRRVEPFHDPFPLLGPTFLDHAMDQHGIDIIGIDYLAVVVNGFEDILGLARDFGLNEHLLSGQAFDGAAKPLERLVGLRTVEISYTLIVG